MRGERPRWLLSPPVTPCCGPSSRSRATTASTSTSRGSCTTTRSARTTCPRAASSTSCASAASGAAGSASPGETCSTSPRPTRSSRASTTATTWCFAGVRGEPENGEVAIYDPLAERTRLRLRRPGPPQEPVGRRCDPDPPPLRARRARAAVRLRLVRRRGLPREGPVRQGRARRAGAACDRPRGADLLPDRDRQGAGPQQHRDAQRAGPRRDPGAPVRGGAELPAIAAAAARDQPHRRAARLPHLRSPAAPAARLLREQLGGRDHQAHAAGGRDPPVHDRQAFSVTAGCHGAPGLRAGAAVLQRQARGRGAGLLAR